MFQYAATRALSIRMNTECAFPSIDPDLHDIFCISDTPEQVNEHIYVEPGFHYNPLPESDSNIALQGYFQSEKYFRDCDAEVRDDFRFKTSRNMVPQTGTVSIHVRRGDYLEKSTYHPLCSMDYYHTAIALFPKWKFMVFSDDPEWCKQNFDSRAIEIIDSGDAVHDLELMSMCEHHIIANSSFSWWGAWLGKHPDQRVIAPSKWFGPDFSEHDTRDLYCEHWTVI